MKVHYASVFAWQKFQEDIYSFVELVDKKNFKPLNERACAAIREMREREVCDDQEWPLAAHGQGSLPTEDEIKYVATPGAYDLGDWFLIILAEYLQPCTSPLGNWSVLKKTLALLGWNEQDYELLFIGFPNYKLLKPRLDEKSAWPITNQSPYWLWLHPHHSRAGWLPYEEVHNFQARLIEMGDEIRAFDVRRIPDIDADNPVVVEDYKDYLTQAYLDTLAMLSKAESLEQGLFMSVWFG
ncbi:MAG: hypothetical protein KC441_18580 [Anaerolineales bacterium]|nr:hypothetical protein [Anaerolineales bacterium]